MSVQQFTINFPGQVSITPRIGHMYAPTSTLSQVTAAGFLDSYIQSQGFSLLPTDVVLVVASNGTQWYKPVFTSNSVQLTVLP